tara:strand:+ start:553 stop:1884 length:1332 start_codon:yes stop_codon:yes gene_type:complete
MQCIFILFLFLFFTAPSWAQEIFQQQEKGLNPSETQLFGQGRGLFKSKWSGAPTNTKTRYGLGPLYNEHACISCHVRGGRAPVDMNQKDAQGLLFRLGQNSIILNSNAQHAKHGRILDPIYGGQLQDKAAGSARINAEGRLKIKYQLQKIILSDATEVHLRKPTYSIQNLNYGALDSTTSISARIAPALHGLGLLEHIDEATLHDLQQQQQLYGISGKINRVWDIKQQKYTIGRFGWKATQPSLEQQNAAAFQGDMGFTTYLFPNHPYTTKQADFLNLIGKGEPEIIDLMLQDITFYTRHIAVPKPSKNRHKNSQLGKKLFRSLHCASCHTPRLDITYEKNDQIKHKTIHPYTDLMLHDMGEGLASGFAVFQAEPAEWRTAPLWGLGTLKAEYGKLRLLHDGRARSIEEAILWHAGEAQQAKENYMDLTRQERKALRQFLMSL